MKRVVITGIGAITPLGNDIKATWDNLTKGISGISYITRFDQSCLSTRIAGEIKDFSPEDYLPKRDVLRLDPFIHYAFASALMALEDAGLISQEPVATCDSPRREVSRHMRLAEARNQKSNPPLPPFTKRGCGGINFSLFTLHSSLNSAGIVIGSSRGGIISIEKALENHFLKGKPFSAYLMSSSGINMAGSYISKRLGIRGPVIGISTACASGASAIGEALRLLRSGEIELAIAGGSEAPICRLAVGGYEVMGSLSKRNNEPERASRPFDKDRDGFVISEGACIVVLEEFKQALKRDARIYAEVIGYGTSSDAFHIVKPLSDGEAIAIDKALKDAKVSINAVDYINAHATSTPLGDKTETEAIKKVFGKRAYDIPVSASKSMLGHMLGGAGAIEAAITALSLNKGIITPTMNLESSDTDCDLNYVRKTESRDINIAISNSFGFGGVNAVLIFRKC